MGPVPVLTISQVNIRPFALPLVRPFTFDGNTLTERSGYYLECALSNGVRVQGEISPLPGVSAETLKKAKHDLEEYVKFLPDWQIPAEEKALIQEIKKDDRLKACAASVRFGIESVLFSRFLKSSAQVSSAGLLQGSADQVIADAKDLRQQGIRVFKLKVGDRNIALDVKKVQEVRAAIGPEALIRLDGNRVWSMNEAVLFVQMAGLKQIEFIEEPLSDMSKLNEFYESTHMPVALDETLMVARPNVTAPGRCMPTLATQEGVKAFVIKPMILGGIVVALDWIGEATSLGKKAIISSAFESPVGLTVLQALAVGTGETPGLGTGRWFHAH